MWKLPGCSYGLWTWFWIEISWVKIFSFTMVTTSAGAVVFDLVYHEGDWAFIVPTTIALFADFHCVVRLLGLQGFVQL